MPETLKLTCSECGDGFVAQKPTDLCKGCVVRKNKRIPREMTCFQCQARFVPTPKARTRFIISQRPFCGKTCSTAFRAQASSVRMTKTNLRDRDRISARMRANNPMADEETRIRMAQTLHEIGHKPIRRGGNGTGMTEPQAKLYQALLQVNPLWAVEFTLAVGLGRSTGYPHAYKLDLALPSLKLAVEVDGFSHTSIARQQQDRKKTEWLQSIGWTVLRFTNAAVMENLNECLVAIASTISKLTPTTPTLPTT